MTSAAPLLSPSSSGIPARAAGVRRPSLGRRFAAHPEAGALAGTVVVFCFFAIVAGSSGFLTLKGTGNWISDASEIGIVAVGVGMLMIAGEFDLSIGSILGAATMTYAVSVGYYNLSPWLAAVVALAVSVLIGVCNGILVIKTGLPSFLVTLATLFIVAGLTLGITVALTGNTTVSTQITGPAEKVFAGQWNFFSTSIIWLLAIAVVAHVVLRHTAVGNRIYATGGDTILARAAGVRTNAIKVTLFAVAAACAGLVGIIQTTAVQSGDVARGADFQFTAIIAASIGGILLTGGYGAITGVILGALTYGMADIGVFYTGWNSAWFQVILGALLLVAVLSNNVIRRKAMSR
jgi:simple sugar transport system permease protein